MSFNKIPLVSIECLVYNHAPFLRQCLDGFVMQKTDFPFEAIVHDDASTDNSAEIIREYAEKYPDIIKPIYETENQYSKDDGTLERIVNGAIHSNAKYVALCEGDDYWTNPLKLQKQVDYMEAHPECSLTYHACKNKFESPNLQGLYGETVKESYTSVTLLDDYFHTATIVMRKNIFDSDLYKKALATKCLSGDTMISLTASRLGTLHGFNEKWSVYRRHTNGISSSMEDKEKIYSNYKSWVAVSGLFGKGVKKKIERNRLKIYIVRSFMYKDFRLLFKLICYGLNHSPNSVVYAMIHIIKYCFRRIFSPVFFFAKQK